MSSEALASLTANYTDSEGEAEPEEDDNTNPGSVTLNTPNGSPTDSKSTPSSRPQSPVVKVTTKRQQLVSYHDDTFVSDEEGEGEKHQIVIISENESLEKGDTEEGDGEIFKGFEFKSIERYICSSDDSSSSAIPPEPLGHCSMDLQDKILRLHEKMQNNALDMNAVIQQRKDFRNPSIYEKLIQYCGINELGTNYPPSMYDPLKWSKESYYEELAKVSWKTRLTKIYLPLCQVQKTEMDRRDKERKSKVEVVSGTKKQEEDAKKRKSKWDQPGGNTISSQTLKPAGLVQPSLTSSATGTKGTVISAFGSLPKKPRP